MRPSSKSIIDGISWVLDKRVAPHATEAWAASSLRSISGLLKHLSVRVELEGPLLAEDNADLRAVLSDATTRLDGGSLRALKSEVAATLEREWRNPGAYPTVASLEEENEALNEHVERLIHVLHDDAAPIDAQERAELKSEIADYLKRQRERERPLYVPAFTGPPF
jgi:hypothetical protein